MIKVLEMRGYAGLRAFYAFHKLMLGLKMLPSYCGESYEEFFERIHLMGEEDQKKVVREAAIFVDLNKDEVHGLVGLCADRNGVPYRDENIKSLSPQEIIDCIVAVSMEIVKIPIGILSDDEKKKLRITP